jgi:hypothetical protein
VVTNRPLQGQSPYVFNAGFSYSDTEKGYDLSINANRVGRRVAYVSVFNRLLVWENPRTVIDISASKTFFKKLQAKLILGDILAQDLVYYYDLNANKSYDAGKDVAFTSWKNGFTTSLNLTYTF